MRHLQRLYDDLVAAQNNKPGVLGKLFGKKDQAPVKGLYFWGGVGRGKTYLVDTFYEALPFEQKMRTHFHRFMKRVHEEMRTLKGEKNPLTVIAKRFSNEARVICFDEFFVSDITDAMILGTLMEELFKNGVSLVATSNIVPDGLYKDGLQRARFLPAIAMIKQYTDVVNVDSGVDYRLRHLEQAELFHFPLDAAAHESLRQSFKALTPECTQAVENDVLMIENREIHALRTCDDVGVLLDQRNGGQETCALQTVLVQTVRHDVRGGHQRHAVLEQLFHQRAEDHGVGDVGDEELIETDDPGFPGELLGDQGQRVFLTLEVLHFFVHTLHEAVEVRAHLVLKRQRFEEGIDQISLATADATPEIQAFDHRDFFLAEQLAEQARLALVGRDQIVVQTLEMTHSVFLSGVVEEFRFLEVVLVAF